VLPVYGHWTGPVSTEGYWRHRAGLPFIHHGWVVLPGGNILDPTRWSFEAVEPYIWVGENDGNYSEGGNDFRKVCYTARPCPAMDEDARMVQLKLDPPATFHLWLYSGGVLAEPDLTSCYVLTWEQLFWVANAPFMDLEPHAREIYQAIIDMKQQALIPIDNRHMAFRDA